MYQNRNMCVSSLCSLLFRTKINTFKNKYVEKRGYRQLLIMHWCVFYRVHFRRYVSENSKKCSLFHRQGRTFEFQIKKVCLLPSWAIVDGFNYVETINNCATFADKPHSRRSSSYGTRSPLILSISDRTAGRIINR